MLLNGIILTCNSRMKDERTINAIFHLITGKRSIQTVQDAHIYGIHIFYGILKSLSKHSFDQRILMMSKNGLLVEKKENTYSITDKGTNWLIDNKQELLFNGLSFYNMDEVFLKRLLLFIQVLTNGKMGNSRYIPIIEDMSITNWMKYMYQEIKPNMEEHLGSLHNELTAILKRLPAVFAEIFVQRLTGFQHYGMSVDQLARMYKKSPEDIKLILIATSHQILFTIQKRPSECPLLVSLTNDFSANNSLTNSARLTYELLQQQFTIQDIASKRQLKVNTIYDHIVEIALHDINFSILPFVSENDQHIILSAIKQANSTKLKMIKDNVSEHISYFQIRLVLARANLQNKGDKIEATNRLGI